MLGRKRLVVFAVGAALVLMAAACDSGGETAGGTEEGAATEEAVGTEAPAATDEPVVTDEAAATDEPGATAEPAATGEDTAAEVPDNPDVGVTADTIRIGWMGDATGPTASAQAFNLRGSEAAIAYFNEQGGVLGRQLELVARDDAFSAETATTNYAALTQDERVLAIVHMGGSHIIAALLPNVEADGVPLISPPQTIEPQLEVPNSYNNFVHSGDSADLAVAYMSEQLGGPENINVAVVQLELPSGDEWNIYLRDSVEAAGGAVLSDRVLLNSSAPDYAGAVTQLQQLIDSGANFIGMHGAPAHALGMVTEMVNQGIDTPMVGISGLAGASIFQEGPAEAAELVHGTHSFLAATSDCEACETIREFTAGTEYEEDIVHLNFSDGWQDIMVAVQAIERAAADAGELSWESMNAALTSGPFDVGGLTCDPDWSAGNHVPCGAAYNWVEDHLEPVLPLEESSAVLDAEYGLAA